MGRPTRLLPLLVVLLLIGSWPAAAQNPDDSPARAAAAAGAVASSFAPDGVPQFLLAATDLVGPAGAHLADPARGHLARFARVYRVSPDDLAAAEIVDVQTVRTGTITRLRQRIGGIDVHGSDVKVLTRGARLVSISGRPLPLGAGRRRRFRLVGRRRAGGRALPSVLTAIPASRPDSGGRRSRISRAAVRDGARKRG